MADQQEQQNRLGAFYLDQSTLECKAGCGFFGNPEWLGYCSICFKQLNHNQQQLFLAQQQYEQELSFATNTLDIQQQKHLQTNHNLPSQQPQQQPAVLYNTDTDPGLVDDKKNQQQMGSVGGDQLEQQRLWWKQQQQQHCLRHTQKFAKEFLATEKQPDKTINDLSDLVHDFYQLMNDRFENHFLYKGATPDQLELLNDNMERTLNEFIYQVISARIINEDEEHNMAIQKRIKSLNWITVEHLEIDIDFKHPIVNDLLDKAICQMIEINSRTSSIDKLECIVQCSKTILELIQASQTSGESVPVSADQFLPVLVFVVIQANPPMLPADMKYLTRFSNPRRLMSGETGYYFTNLCCALEFIEKASGASLNISEEEFRKYVNGEAIPATNSQISTYLCDGLRTMCANDAALKKLRRRNESRQSKVENLIEAIDVHLETNRAKLREMHTFATTLRQKLKPNLPKFFLDIIGQNKDFASKLLPPYLKHAIEISLQPEAKLVDIETNDDDDDDGKGGGDGGGSMLADSEYSATNQTPKLEPITVLDTSQASLSPVEQLESDITSFKLPDPIQPESPNVKPDNK